MSGDAPAASPVAPILALQRTVGNRAVGALLAAAPPAPTVGTVDDARARRGDDVADAALARRRRDAGRSPSDGREPARVVQRKVQADLSKEAFVKKLDEDPAARSELDWIPSTGLGRFDAQYLPSSEELSIEIRVLFDFCKTVGGGAVVPGGWSEEEEGEFFDDFKEQAEAAWSNKYQFRCTKPGWEDLRANVRIDLQRTDDEADAHFRHRIQKEKSMSTGIGREQGDQTKENRVVNVGNFAAQDAPVRPHDSASTCAGIASHDKRRLSNLIEAHRVNPIRFSKGSSKNISSRSASALDKFADAVRQTDRPGSVPVPLLVHGKENKRERMGRGTPAEARADAVVAHLDKDHLDNPVERGKNYTTLVQEQKQLYQSKRSKLAKEAEKAKLDPMKAAQDHREAVLDVDLDFVWKGDPYSILAHEFGHMLGNADEYFEYGSSTIRDQKARQLLDTGRPEDAIRATQIQEMRPSGNESHASVQEAVGDLAERSGQTIPEFGPKTSSIMSAGADVLPVHYAPLWEVLGAITKDAIRPEEWRIA